LTLLIVLHALICVFLVAVILLQPGKGDAGVGFGSSSQTIFGSKGAGNFLTKTTSACAIVFIATSFFLTRSRIMEFSRSVIKERPANAAPKEAPKGKTTPAAKPETPSSPQGSKAPESKASGMSAAPTEAAGAKKK
jgi:preprotein translocase subunit SecG